jgi:uracil-DNA glycosylase family 4
MPAPSTADSLHAVKRYLEQLRSSGVTRLSISEDSLRILAGMPAKHSRAMPSPSTASPAAPLPPTAQSPTAPGDRSPDNDRTARLAEIKEKAAAAGRQHQLGTLRDTMVFAAGSPHASLMLVGEAPGAEEENKGEPFVGPAGQLLTRILKAMGLERSDVYISNVVKYRPAIGDGLNQGPKNRPPSQEEIDAFLPILLSEIDVIRPKIIVALGGTAAKGLLNLDESVGRMRARRHQIKDIPVLVTYHPSYLLRNEALSERRKVWEDLLQVMEHLKMPISEKQRGFFRPS